MKIEKLSDEKLAQSFFNHDYHDRGIMKWNGFMISDHATKLKEANKTAQQSALPSNVEDLAK